SAMSGRQQNAMLKVDSLDLHYGAAQVLRSVSLEARAGEITTVLGRNGVCKTSLLRAITGHEPSSGGRISWDGIPLDGLPPHRRARLGLAFVPQGREIFPLLTVRENLQTGFALLERGERKIEDEIFELFPIL